MSNPEPVVVPEDLKKTYRLAMAHMVEIRRWAKNERTGGGLWVAHGVDLPKLIERIAQTERSLKSAEQYGQQMKEAHDRMVGLAEEAKTKYDQLLVSSPLHRWECFFCEFRTSDPDQAAAHFGDRDDPEEFKPICKWWERMNAEEKVGELQQSLQDLNYERMENYSLEKTIGPLKAEVEELKEKLDDIKDGACHSCLGLVCDSCKSRGESFAEYERTIKELKGKLERVLVVARRVVENKYMDWDKAGGWNECKHGYAAGIPCLLCDRDFILPQPTEAPHE